MAISRRVSWRRAVKKLRSSQQDVNDEQGSDKLRAVSRSEAPKRSRWNYYRVGISRNKSGRLKSQRRN